MRNKIRSDVIDILGKKFSHLTVINKGEKTVTGSKWICKCDCGSTISCWSSNLRSGRQKSCGCLKKINNENHQNDIEKRLLESSEISGECRIWKATHKSEFGYGMIIIRRKSMGAHRAAWLTWRGKIPDGMCVLHTCDNPKCINPDHLFLGTRTDNHKDMVQKDRQCRLKGEDNGHSKLSEKHVLEIRKISKEKKANISELSRKYKVSRFCINSIIHKRSWKHI